MKEKGGGKGEWEREGRTWRGTEVEEVEEKEKVKTGTIEKETLFSFTKVS